MAKNYAFDPNQTIRTPAEFAAQMGGSPRIGDPLGAAATLGELFVSPGKTAANERMNIAAPMVWPSPSDILRAWDVGLLNNDQAAQALGSMGINVGQVKDKAWKQAIDKVTGIAGHELRNTCWRNVVAMSRMYPPLTTLIRSSWAGIARPADVDRWVKIGYNTDRESWDAVAQMLRDYPGQGQLDTLFLRGAIPHKEWERLTRLTTACDADTLGNFAELRYQYPAHQSAIQYAARQVWTVGAADDWQLYNGMPPEVEDYYQRDGLGRQTDEVRVIDGVPGNLTYALMDWAQHWQLPGPSQVCAMYHQLRPERMSRYVGLGISPEPISLDDCRQLLTLASVPPSMQDEVIASSYRLIPMRLLRIYWVTEQWTDQQTRDALQDYGFTPQDASDLVDAWDLQLYQAEQAKEQALQARAETAYIRQLVSMYEQGSITQADITTAMMQADWQPERAAVVVSTADLRVQEQSIAQRIGYLRREYLRGGYKQYEVELQLQQMGISVDRSAQYAADWQWELTHTRLSISTGQVLRLYREGILDRQSAYSRLSNMGWTDPDEQLLFAEVDKEIAASQAKQFDAALKSRVKQAGAYQRLQKQAVKQFNAAQKALRQQIGVGKTLSLLRDGVVDAEWAERHLLSIGETPESVQLLLAQAHVQVSRADLKQLQTEVRRAEGIARLVPKADLEKAVGTGVISVSQFQAALAQQGLTAPEIELETALYAPRNTASPVVGALVPSAASTVGPTPPVAAVSQGAAQGTQGLEVGPGGTAALQPTAGGGSPTAGTAGTGSVGLLGGAGPGQGAMTVSPLPVVPALTTPPPAESAPQQPPEGTPPPGQSTETGT
jgi:hypothetical protein